MPCGPRASGEPFSAIWRAGWPRSLAAPARAQERLPRIGFMAYGPSDEENYRRAATDVDKILKGARPGNVPVEQPIRFELVVNRKTARALGLALPPALLRRADRAID